MLGCALEAQHANSKDLMFITLKLSLFKENSDEASLIQWEESSQRAAPRLQL